MSRHFRSLLAQFGLTPKSKHGLILVTNFRITDGFKNG
jgi:hypothetical protein